MNPIRPVSGWTADQLIQKLADARGRLKSLMDCLPAGGWLGPRAEHLNPPLWEYGHIVWFQERWCLRAQDDGSFAGSMLDTADALYDSSNVAHATRWDLRLLEPAAVDEYAARVADAIASRLRNGLSNALAYFAELCVYHELMHVEAWWMAFQDLGYAPPVQLDATGAHSAQRLPFPAGEVELGSGPDEGFIFDNEKWRHALTVPAFDIDATPVSEASFAAFVDAGGYQQHEKWSAAGRAWLQASGARHPLYWRQKNGGWQVRRFDRWTPLVADAPMRHINRYEAEACAAWVGRRLPTAGQWVRAAAAPVFCRGMVWEWLGDMFVPYPGFSPDPYCDYSQPWFHTHGELRGGGPVTDLALKRPGFRNFYQPHRRDPFAGFRTASLDE